MDLFNDDNHDIIYTILMIFVDFINNNPKKVTDDFNKNIEKYNKDFYCGNDIRTFVYKYYFYNILAINRSTWKMYKKIKKYKLPLYIFSIDYYLLPQHNLIYTNTNKIFIPNLLMKNNDKFEELTCVFDVNFNEYYDDESRILNFKLYSGHESFNINFKINSFSLFVMSSLYNDVLSILTITKNQNIDEIAFEMIKKEINKFISTHYKNNIKKILMQYISKFMIDNIKEALSFTCIDENVNVCILDIINKTFI